MKNYKFILLSVLMLGVLFSCSKDYERPPLTEPTYEGAEANITIKRLKEIYADAEDPTLIDVDFTIKATVIGNDVSGNIFKQLYIQDDTGGINMGVDQNSVYTEYRVGQEIYVNLKGLYILTYGGQLQIGYDKTQANRIPWEVFDFYVHKNGWPNSERVSPRLTTISALKDDMVNTLVKLEKVYFVDGGKEPFAEPEQTVNRDLKDGDGKTIIVRNSGYANFAADMLPEGGGTVVGVLSKHFNDWQIFLRSADDVQNFGQPLPDGGGDEPGGGDQPSGDVLFKETFDGGDVGSRPKVGEYKDYDNKDVTYSDPSGNVDLRQTTALSPHLWFPANRDSYFIIEGIDLSAGKDLVLKYEITANLYDAGSEIDINAMEVKVNGTEMSVPSKVISNDAGDNNKYYEVTLVGVPAAKDVKIEFIAGASANTKGFRLDNISVVSQPGASNGVKAK